MTRLTGINIFNAVDIMDVWREDWRLTSEAPFGNGDASAGLRVLGLGLF